MAGPGGFQECSGGGLSSGAKATARFQLASPRLALIPVQNNFTAVLPNRDNLRVPEISDKFIVIR